MTDISTSLISRTSLVISILLEVLCRDLLSPVVRYRIHTNSPSFVNLQDRANGRNALHSASSRSTFKICTQHCSRWISVTSSFSPTINNRARVKTALESMTHCVGRARRATTCRTLKFLRRTSMKVKTGTSCNTAKLKSKVIAKVGKCPKVKLCLMTKCCLSISSRDSIGLSQPLIARLRCTQVASRWRRTYNAT